MKNISKLGRSIVALLVAAVIGLSTSPVIANSCFGTQPLTCPFQSNIAINGGTYNCTSTTQYPSLVLVTDGWMNSKPTVTTCRYTCVRTYNGFDYFVYNHPIDHHSYEAWSYPTQGAQPCNSSGGSGGNNS